MKLIIKIGIYVAILIGVAVLVLAMFFATNKIEQEKSKRMEVEKKLTAEEGRAKKLEDEKASIKKELEDVVAVKQEVEKDRDAAKEEAKQLSALLETEKKEKELLKKKLEEKQQAALALMKQLRLAREASAGAEKAEELQAKVGELSTEKRELLEKLRTTEAERDQLNNKLEEMVQKEKPTIKLDDIFVRTELKFSGYILTVNDKYNFVIINLGERDKLPVGEILIVHRGRKLIGKIRVDRVYEKMAACAILPEWLQQGEFMQEDDSVKKF